MCTPVARRQPAGTHACLHTLRGPSQAGCDAMHETDILPRFQERVVRDAFASYFKCEQCSHALCNAHHPRELQSVEDEYGQSWSGKIADLWRPRTRWKRLHHSVLPITRDATVRCSSAALRRTLLLRSRHRRSGWIASRRVATRRWHSYAISAPVDNNLAERDVRMMKVKQWISGTRRRQSGSGDVLRDPKLTLDRSQAGTRRSQRHTRRLAWESLILVFSFHDGMFSMACRHHG
jgi:hypothetical protein